MSTPVHIKDGSGAKYRAAVTNNNQLIVAPLHYDDVKQQSLNVDGVAENFWVPKTGHQIVITGMIIGADRNVATAGGLVEIFEAVSPTSGTATKAILSMDVVKSTTIPLLGLNLLITSGVYVNGKTDDDDVFATITGYYIDEVV